MEAKAAVRRKMQLAGTKTAAGFIINRAGESIMEIPV
jgi:hypothetical protein